jgi:hypothetical protein
MNRIITRGVFAAAAMLFAVSAFAAEFGTPEEARALLDRVGVAMKADPTATLAKINAGDAEFRDRDLYPFCIGADGIVTAHPDPTQPGTNTRERKDVDGKAFGEEIMNAGEEGKIAEVTYKWPRLGTQEPVPKVSLITKIGDQICGVGYYK